MCVCGNASGGGDKVVGSRVGLLSRDVAWVVTEDKKEKASHKDDDRCVIKI